MAELLFPCLCNSISIIEDLIDVRAKMKINDPSASSDLVNIIKNYDSYSKKEKRMVRNTLKVFLEQNASFNNSAITINNGNSNSPEMKDH